MAEGDPRRTGHWFDAGVLRRAPFWAVDMAGFLIDTLRGATIGIVFNPAMSVQTSIFGLLFSQFLCALFIITGDSVNS